MKRLIALLLCVLLLSASAALADKTAIGTLNINGVFTLRCGLPEGYQVTTVVDDGSQVIARIQSDDPLKPVMMLSVAFDELYAGVDRMNYLDEEALAVLEATFTEPDPSVEITYGDTGLGTRLLIARQTLDDAQYIDFLSIYKGYFVEFVMIASEQAEDKTLSAEQLQLCIDFLTDLDFIPGEQSDLDTAAGQTFIARLGDYDDDANELTVTLRLPVLLGADAVDALKEGDTLSFADETVIVEKAERDEFGDVVVNDDYILTPDGNGSYKVSLYEVTCLQDGTTVTVTVPDTLVFIENIDPETLEILEEPAVHTAAELIAALQSDVGPGFDNDNVRVTFGENGELVQVVREYVPWQ